MTQSVNASLEDNDYVKKVAVEKKARELVSRSIGDLQSLQKWSFKARLLNSSGLVGVKA